MNKTHVIGILAGITMILTSTVHAVDTGKLKFVEIRREASPLVTFRIILRAGAINDPSGKEGLNALTAYMIAQGGTKDLTYQQVVEKFYPWAAGIDVQADQEITTFVGDVHRDHLGEFYKLFSDLLLHPRFDPSDFQRLKDIGINYLKNSLRATEDENLGKQALNVLIYGGHPYGKTEVGTVQGLTAITLDDVKDYYQKIYTQANLWIGIAGGYQAALTEQIRNDFSALPEG